MEIDKQQVLEALRGLPARVQHVGVCDGYVNIRMAASGHDSVDQKLAAQVVEAVEKLDQSIKQVRVEFAPAETAPPPPPAVSPQPPPVAGLPNVNHVIAVGAGKGGVGKSTVAVNLAVGLARRGRRIGLLDGDIYGPSAPTLLGLGDMPIRGTQQTLIPFQVHGVKAMTIGKLVDADKPLVWRGPMAHGAFRQLAMQTDWGTLDELIVDLPPGTGDVPLTLSQLLPLTGAVIVCTPQKVAQDDAVRAVGMFKQLNVPVLGVVENMSYFIGDDGKEYDIFGKGGAVRMAERLGLPLLGQIPINMELRRNSDAGNPTANYTGQAKLAEELDRMTAAVLHEAERQSAPKPKLSIS